MENQKRITIIVCKQPSTIEKCPNKISDAKQGITSYNFIGHIPNYFINTSEEYRPVCLIKELQKTGISFNQFLANAKKDILQVNKKDKFLCLFIEESLLEPLLLEFDNPDSGDSIMYFIMDPEDSPEVKSCLRRIILVKNEGLFKMDFKIGEQVFT